jgi:hypothetical protein
MVTLESTQGVSAGSRSVASGKRILHPLFAIDVLSKEATTPKVAVRFSKGESEMRYRFCYACHNVFHRLLSWAMMDFALGISVRPQKPVHPVLP